MTDNPPLWDQARAQTYIARHSNHPMTHGWVRFADLRETDILLDIGCGDGTAIAAALPKIPDGRAIGIDPSPDMTAAARDRFAAQPRVDIQQAPAERIPVADHSVTVVLANCSATHWADIRQGLREVARVLVPGGRLVCVEENFGGSFPDHLPLDQNVMKSGSQLPNLLLRGPFTRINTRRLHEMGTPFFMVTAVATSN